MKASIKHYMVPASNSTATKKKQGKKTNPITSNVNQCTRTLLGYDHFLLNLMEIVLWFNKHNQLQSANNLADQECSICASSPSSFFYYIQGRGVYVGMLHTCTQHTHTYIHTCIYTHTPWSKTPETQSALSLSLFF